MHLMASLIKEGQTLEMDSSQYVRGNGSMTMKPSAQITEIREGPNWLVMNIASNLALAHAVVSSQDFSLRYDIPKHR